jgi:hypothetical protein
MFERGSTDDTQEVWDAKFREQFPPLVKIFTFYFERSQYYRTHYDRWIQNIRGLWDNS